MKCDGFRDADGCVVRPVPRIKKALSQANCLPHLVQLLLTFDPTIVERVSTLLYHVIQAGDRFPVRRFTGFSSGQSIHLTTLSDRRVLLHHDVQRFQRPANCSISSLHAYAPGVSFSSGWWLLCGFFEKAA